MIKVIPFSRMRTKRFQTLLASFFITSFSAVHSQTFTYIAEPQGINAEWSGIDFTGNIDEDAILLPNSTISGQLDLNVSDGTVIFRRITLDIDDRHRVDKVFVVDGQDVPITTTLDFDFTLNFRDDQALTMTSSGNNRFLVNDFERDSLPEPGSPFSGAYSFLGPTDLAVGIFSVNPQWQRQNQPTIDMTDYPNSVAVLGSPSWWTSDDFDLVSDTVDGADIFFGFDEIWIQPRNRIQFVRFAIPEPSTYALAVGVFLLAFILFKRMRRVANAVN